MTPIKEIRATKQLVLKGILTAPPGFLEMPDDELAEICNGCGAADSSVPVPDTIYGLCICAICHIHDFGYFVGKNENEKNEEDDRFLVNGINYIEHMSNFVMRFFRRRRMLKYYEAVTEFGSDAFWAGKKAATE